MHDKFISEDAAVSKERYKEVLIHQWEAVYL
jgi:hypothetical protein